MLYVNVLTELSRLRGTVGVMKNIILSLKISVFFADLRLAGTIAGEVSFPVGLFTRLLHANTRMLVAIFGIWQTVRQNILLILVC